MHNDIEEDKIVVKNDESKAESLRQQQKDKKEEISIEKQTIKNWQLTIIALNN